jgi:3'(2'),5'-bisphosphate nucleotidase
VALTFFRAAVAVQRKADYSPVTEADHVVEATLEAALAALAPDIPVVAEEAVAAGRLPTVGERFFLVDPLDGTREFIDGSGEFTLNIALVVQGTPVFGIVHAPALGETYATLMNDRAVRFAIANPADPLASAEPITARPVPAQDRVAVVSRSHNCEQTEALMPTLGASECIAVGSSLKFCRIADARADVYPRGGPTREWDTAAGDAILRAAGGRVLTASGDPLGYGKPEFLNPAFIAWGHEPA